MLLRNYLNRTLAERAITNFFSENADYCKNLNITFVRRAPIRLLYNPFIDLCSNMGFDKSDNQYGIFLSNSKDVEFICNVNK